MLSAWAFCISSFLMSMKEFGSFIISIFNNIFRNGYYIKAYTNIHFILYNWSTGEGNIKYLNKNRRNAVFTREAWKMISNWKWIPYKYIVRLVWYIHWFYYWYWWSPKRFILEFYRRFCVARPQEIKQKHWFFTNHRSTYALGWIGKLQPFDQNT